MTRRTVVLAYLLLLCMSLLPSIALAEGTQQQTNLSNIEPSTEYVEIVFSDPVLRQYINTSGNTVSWDTPSISEKNNIKWAAVTCCEGDVFTITGVGSNAARLWAFADAEKNILSARAPGDTSAKELVITAPPNAAYLILNDLSDSRSYIGRLYENRPSETETVFSNFDSSSADTKMISGIAELQNISVNNLACSLKTGEAVFTSNPHRLSTCFLKITVPMTIEVGSGYEIRIMQFDQNFMYKGTLSDGKWIQAEMKLNDTSLYYVISVKSTSGNNVPIRAPEFVKAVPNDFSNCRFYVTFGYTLPLLDGLNTVSYEDRNQFNLNINLSGLHDMSWEYQNWVFPQCISCNRYRDQLFFGFLTGDTPANYTGVAAYDFTTKQVTKTILKKNPSKDDHNLTAILVLSNGKILCAYTDGHNDGKNVYIRVSREQESIDRFEDYIMTSFEYPTSYVQIFEYNHKLVMFTREVIYQRSATDQNWRWSYKISEDYGKTWSKEYPFITADRQYYLQITETNTPGVLLVLSYSNPAYDHTEIRASYLHLDTMELFQKNNTDRIGTTNIDYRDIGIAVSPENGKKLRLYNAARTNVGDIKFVFSQSTPTLNLGDGAYKIYDNGQVHDIAAAGKNLLEQNVAGGTAQLGIAMIGTDRIVLSRADDGKDLLELYDYDSSTGVSTLAVLIDSVDNTKGVRIARPMVDVNNRAFVYWKGYFNSNNYTDFFADGRVYEIS